MQGTHAWGAIDQTQNAFKALMPGVLTHHNILGPGQPREDVGLLRLSHNPEGTADMEVLIHRAVVVGDGVHMLRVDQEVVGKAGVPQIMHGRRTDEAEDLELGEVE